MISGTAQLMDDPGAGSGQLMATQFKFFILELAQPVANGAASVSTPLSPPFPGNAIVESFPVKIQAGRADWTRSGNVAQLRQRDISASGETRTSMVLDFGVMRTVSGVAIEGPSALQVIRVKPWTGMGFGDPTMAPDGPETTFIFPSEVRTERLQIDLVGGGNDDQLKTSVLVQLPDAPADLELRVENNPPVWTAPGAVTPGQGNWSNVDPKTGLASWQPPVQLGPALTKLFGDPSAPKTSNVTLSLTLSARVPGALNIALPNTADQVIRFLARVTDGFPDGKRDLKFAEEGLVAVPLALPDWVTGVEQVKLTVAANLPRERVMPPVGPDPAIISVSGAAPLVEMLLDPDHAACVALPQSFGLAELLGVRLPLRAGEGGAEVRVLLLAPNPQGGPGVPVDGGSSRPVTLDTPTAPVDVWTTFSFPHPIALDASALPWVVVNVGRGRVAWALTDSPLGGEVRRGPPSGPWQDMPALPGGVTLYGRLRMVGHAAPTAPLAPLLLNVRGASPAAAPQEMSVSPTPKGAEVEWPSVGAAANPPPLITPLQHSIDLLVTSRVAGSLTVRDVVVKATDK